MRTVTMIGKSSGGIDIGCVPLPCASGKGDGAFYPLSVSVERYSKLLYRARNLGLESQFDIECGSFSGNVLPASFGRFDTMPADERILQLWPGAANNLAVANNGDVRLTAGEVQIGWCAGTPLGPLSPLPVGSWPPVASTSIDFGPDSVGNCVGNGLECCYVNGGTAYPFIFIWFLLEAPDGSGAYYFTPNNFEFSGDSTNYEYKKAEIRLQLFGWGTIDLYKLWRTSFTEPIIKTNAIKIKAQSFYQYAEEDSDNNASNPVYDQDTGRQLISPVPRDISYNPVNF